MNTAPMFWRRSVRGLTIGSLLMAAAFGLFVIVASAQSSPADQSSPRPAESKPAPEKSPEARPAAKPNHHFDRVLVIVLENADYEAAVRDKNLAELATHGASFSNFHALFHPSYPNYLALVAGTDFGTHRRARIFADKQVNFPADT